MYKKEWCGGIDDELCCCYPLLCLLWISQLLGHFKQLQSCSLLGAVSCSSLHTGHLLTHCSVTSTCLFIISCQITTLQCVEGRCGSSAVAGGDSLYSIQIWNNKIAFQIFNFFWHWHFCDIWLLSSKMLGWRIYFQFLFRYLLHHSLKEVSIGQTELECSELNQNVYMHLVSLKTNKFSPTQSKYLMLHSMIFSALCVLVTLGSCLCLCVVYVGWALPNSL